MLSFQNLAWSMWEITQPFGLRCRAENKASACAALPCGSGRAREACDAVHGTGFAGVRGRARSHKTSAKSKSYVLFYESLGGKAANKAGPEKKTAKRPRKAS